MLVHVFWFNCRIGVTVLHLAACRGYSAAAVHTLHPSMDLLHLSVKILCRSCPGKFPACVHLMRDWMAALVLLWRLCCAVHRSVINGQS
jgi:hypothetical protein